MSGLQRAAARVRYVIGAAVGASLMVSQVHPDAIGAQAIHGRLVRMDPLPPDVCVWPAAVQWAEQAGRQGRRASTHAAGRSDEDLRRPSGAQGSGSIRGIRRRIGRSGRGTR